MTPPVNVAKQTTPSIGGRPIRCLFAPSNLGLKKMAYADETGPGTGKMPFVFAKHLFCERLGIPEPYVIYAPAYEDVVDKESGIRNIDQVIAYTHILEQVIGSHIDAGNFPVVVGGDCSILLGAAVALKRRGNFGLAHIDGHTDFAIAHVSSSTGGVAGMDLALVTGRGTPLLTNIEGLCPYFQERYTAQFGNRCYDDTFNGDFYKTEIFHADLPDLRKTGMNYTAHTWLRHLENEHINGFWIHIDADVLNDEVMPCVDSRQPDGLSYDELRSLVKTLLDSGSALGIQFTIYDPDLDEDGSVGERWVDELTGTLTANYQ